MSTNQLSADIHAALKRYWGYDAFRPLQEEIILSVLEGRDTLGLMPTGGGKSLTFQVPAMVMEGICIVVTPLIALMKDQKDNLQALGIKAAAVYTGMSRGEVLTTLENCIFGDYKFLYVSPERLSNELFLAKMRAMKVSLLVVDESHCISQWGYDFRPSYLRIAEVRKELPGVPVLALTASATPEVVDDIMSKLQFRAPNVFRKSFDRPNLAYVVRETDDKAGELRHILTRVGGTAIVYVRSRKRTKEIADMLVAAGFSADHYHAGLAYATKLERQEAWKSGELRIIVSTNAFGMGIDKPDVRVVVHMDLPGSPEEYYQEAGRAGRDGEKSYAVVLHAAADSAKLKRRVDEAFPEREFIRRVYHSLGSFFQVAEGAGEGALFDFDPYKFSHVYKYPPVALHHALKLLQQAGYIEYDPEFESSSRIMLTVRRDELYRLREFDERTTRVLQAILRLYTGVFADYVFIQEEAVMRFTHMKRQEVYERLLQLSRQGVLHYVPGRKGPTILFTQPRIDAERVRIPRAVYEDMRQRMKRRVEGMLDYAQTTHFCRTRILLRYFGEKMAHDCGRCDVCLARKAGSIDDSEFAELESALRRVVVEEEITELGAVVTALLYPEERVEEVIRFLLDEGVMGQEGGKVWFNE